MRRREKIVPKMSLASSASERPGRFVAEGGTAGRLVLVGRVGLLGLGAGWVKRLL